jgi:hypothetical protein
MKLIKELNEGNPKTLFQGLTEISFDKKFATIFHAGNMGNRESDVEKNVNKILKGDYFKKLKAKGEFKKDKYNTHNDPSYSYILKIPLKDYKEIVGLTEPLDEMVKHASREEHNIENAIKALQKKFKDAVKFDPNKSQLELSKLEKMITDIYRAGYEAGASVAISESSDIVIIDHKKVDATKLPSQVIAPFTASGNWVNDARGRGVAECNANGMPPEIVAYALNQVYKPLKKRG